MSKKICLDAGHYGKYNRSPAVKSYCESEMNWKLHLLLRKYLIEYGFTVIQTRSDQTKDMALTTRGKKAKGCDLFLSIHSNAVAGGVDESIDYPVVYKPISGAGSDIAEKLAKCIAEVMETKQSGRTSSRKGNNGDYYGVIRGATSVGVPGLILEHSFHTNTRATNWLLDDENLDKLARAEAKVIAEHFGVNNTTDEEVCNVKIKVLEKGMKGEEVKAMQILLIGYGYSCGSTGADGSFGGNTKKALDAYKKAHGLAENSKCDENTWASLLGC
jgi:N-acetylmuramoyl-L-alanine amidase